MFIFLSYFVQILLLTVISTYLTYIEVKWTDLKFIRLYFDDFLYFLRLHFFVFLISYIVDIHEFYIAVPSEFRSKQLFSQCH